MALGKAVYGRLMALLAAILFGCESVAVQLCYADGFTVMGLIAVRYGLAALLFGITLIFTRSPFWVAKEYRRQILILGLLFIASNWLLFISLAYLSAPLAILFFYAYPSLTAVVARFIYKEHLGMVKIYALVISMLGLFMLYWSSAGEISVLGTVVALAAAFLNALKLNMAEKVMSHVNVYTFSFDMAFIMCTFSIPLCLICGQFPTAGIPISGWLYAAGLALFVSYGSMLLINSSLKFVNAVDVSIICLMEPPVTALTAFLVFRDILSGWQIIGACLVMLSVAVPQISQLKANKSEAGNKVENTER